MKYFFKFILTKKVNLFQKAKKWKFRKGWENRIRTFRFLG